ncbi:hypothetical protein P5V63_21830 [Mycobacteroides abscessus subsp. abscessus]|uniref:hypothetical protein n=2 Tax=Mycobacteroides abscessus TaxID=36809 RepID=UPI00078D34F3|nr:hypothetical protein [Mycobacteroides abscessus]AMU62786.1 hypothetical protein A3O03_23865 [Mycobacteroides abscessus]MDM2600723.1 hypothetical protein [Mycobacteroides abscessus]MDM2612846.1 hypothetical protein [Mycobacteroides abscessus]MDM2617760.1 hypothetical protein [Mycobacteroides abscessus]MDM2622649.1 hypothetical protein [Mycobacteroides abscessus]
MHRMKAHPEAALGDCPARFDNYVCTRDAGHDGSHMANAFVEVVAIWDNELAWRADDAQGCWAQRKGREWVEADA